jgi:hypothetical protein
MAHDHSGEERFILEALAQLPGTRRHIVIDPLQQARFKRIGLRHVREAGYEHLIEFWEDRSEFVLPRLASQGTAIDFAFIDGLHRFDQVMIDFYFINRMLTVGGIVAFDDNGWAPVHKAVRHVASYPAYEPFNRMEPPRRSRSLVGILRRQLAKRALAVRFIRPEILHPAWDIGIGGTCVALRKVRPDERPHDWHQDF